MLRVNGTSAFVGNVGATRAVVRAARRVARCSLATRVLLAVEVVNAQSPRRTTVGRLLGEPVDTIEVEERDGGELGSKGASLRLVRGDSGYIGTLRMLVAVVPHVPNVAPWRCDTLMTASMTTSAATRLFAFLRPTAIELGEASQQLPITDYSWSPSD